MISVEAVCCGAAGALLGAALMWQKARATVAALEARLANETRDRARNERWMQQVIHTIPMSVLVLDGDRIVTVNEVGLRFAADRAQWQPGCSVRAADPATAAVLLDKAAEVARTQQPVVFDLEIGALVVEFTLLGLEGAEGRALTAVLGRDVTAKRRSQLAMRALTQRALRMREEADERLSRELHDEMSLLTALQLQSRVLENTIARWPDAPHALVDQSVELSALADQTIREVRRISQNLRPASLQQLGLASAVSELARGFARRTGTPVQEHLDEPRDLDDDTVTTFFRVAVEAIDNVERHAKASALAITLRQSAADTTLVIEDDGVGLDAAREPGLNLGLLGMEERAASSGGALRVEARTPRGTRVSLTVPRSAS